MYLVVGRQGSSGCVSSALTSPSCIPGGDMEEVDVVGGPPFVPGVVPEMAALRAGTAEEIPEVADARRVELVVGPRDHALTL